MASGGGGHSGGEVDVGADVVALPVQDGTRLRPDAERGKPRLRSGRTLNADPERETEVRLLWTPESLFVRFHARFRVITVFPDAEPNGRRDR